MILLLSASNLLQLNFEELKNCIISKIVLSQFSQDSNSLKEKLVDVEQHYYLSLDELQNVTDTYVKSLNKKPKLVWKTYVNELLKGIKKFDAEEELLIFDIEYFKKVALFFARTSETDIGIKYQTNFVKFLICSVFQK